MAKEKIKIGQDGIYDARQLGAPKMVVLGFQHMFAMFGATVTVPLLTGLSISTTLLFAGLGTLLFHLLTKFKVPAFLGSSFAFLGGYFAVKGMAPDGTDPNAMLPYACLGVACAGLLYLVLSALIKLVGINKVMRLFPPVVTGPIIIAIGLGLAPSAVTNCSTNWILAVVALVLVIIFNIFGKGMVKIVPILLGIIGSYLVAVLVGNVGGVESFAIDFSGVKEAAWIGNPIEWSSTVFGGVHDKGLATSAIIAIVPIAVATMMEHIGDISAISSTTNRNFIQDPGLDRTLLGDGLATTLASLFGAPANTTYGENTGVLALSKVYDPRVVRIAAYFAVAFSFCPKFAAVIESIPTAVVGGISFVLYGMISAIGVRNVVEAKVDFSKARNTIVAAVILVIALGMKSWNVHVDTSAFEISKAVTDLSVASTDGIAFTVGKASINITSLALASIVGILVNLIFPEKDFDPEQAFKADTDSKQINLKSDYGKKAAKENAD